jgi:hypothetical protein
MKVLPIHRLQSYFRELELEEDRKLKSAAGFTYIGGPEQLSEALLSEQEPLPGHYTVHATCPECRRWQMCTAVVLVAMGLVVWVCGR